LPTEEFPLVCRRGNVAQAGMSSLPVVEHFNVFADLGHCFLASAVFAVMNQFGLEGAEEAFHRGVVIAVPLATHGWHHTELFEQLLVALRAILAATA